MKWRVALVDDNAMDRLLAAEALGEVAPDCTLDPPASGDAALGHLCGAQPLPGGLLLDLNMPALNGFGGLQALKADPRLSLVSVVMFTTSGVEADVKEAYILRASACRVKAPDFTVVLAQLEAFTRYWALDFVPL